MEEDKDLNLSVDDMMMRKRLTGRIFSIIT